MDEGSPVTSAVVDGVGKGWTWRRVLLISGAAILLGAGYAVYRYNYMLGPVIDLTDPAWTARHSKAAIWERLQQNHRRCDSAPDMMALDRGMWIAVYGDRAWALWICDNYLNTKGYRRCGCNHAALSVMTNQRFEDIKAWYAENRDKTQEQWILEGFAQVGVAVEIPPSDEQVVQLLRVIGDHEHGSQHNRDYLQYNAMRVLRDSGVELGRARLVKIQSENPELAGAVIDFVAARVRYEGGLGVLRFRDEAPVDRTRPGSWGSFWARWLPGTGVALGLLVILVAALPVSRRRFPTWCIVAAARWLWRQLCRLARWVRRRWLVTSSAAITALLVASIVVWLVLPEWRPDYVLETSTSLDRIFRASVARPNSSDRAYQRMQDVTQGNALAYVRDRLRDEDPARRRQAVYLLAEAAPEAETDLVSAYHREKDRRVRRTILRVLGWIGRGDDARNLLIGILRGEVEGSRAAAASSLGYSDIADRWDVLEGYRDDPDGKVREEIEDVFEKKKEDEFQRRVETVAAELVSLAKRLVSSHDGTVPASKLPTEVGGRRLLWGRVASGVLDLRFDNGVDGLLVDPQGKSTFPGLPGYFMGGGGAEGIIKYEAQ
ncbi:MAG: HEAT repeat domain-containing protein [Planctomycetota bacterium]|jgi:hypothetical protein